VIVVESEALLVNPPKQESVLVFHLLPPLVLLDVKGLLIVPQKPIYVLVLLLLTLRRLALFWSVSIWLLFLQVVEHLVIV